MDHSSEILDFLSYMASGRENLSSGFATTKAQTSLHIRTVCSSPLLFAYWKVSYLNLLQVFGAVFASKGYPFKNIFATSEISIS